MIVIIIAVLAIGGYFVIYVYIPDSAKVEKPKKNVQYMEVHRGIVMEQLQLLRADMDALTTKIEYWKEMEEIHGQKKQSQDRSLAR